MYDGGPNVKKSLDKATTSELKALFASAEQRAGDHLQGRAMGVGAVHIEDAETKNRFFLNLSTNESKAFLERMKKLRA